MFRWLHSLFSGAAARARPPTAASVQAAPDAVPALAAAPVQPDPAAAAVPSPVPFDRLAHVDGLWNGWLFDRPAGSLDLNDAEQRVLDASPRSSRRGSPARRSCGACLA